MDRDDFAESTKRTLAARVNHSCSNPDCRAPTSGPQVDEGKALNLGVAAHIAAAAVGGPRFDSAMTEEQRRGQGNGIWLCQNCAKLIDNDTARYRAPLIAAWKEVAEHHALIAIGKSDRSQFGVDDEWVAYGYVEEAGITARLKAEGYVPQWVHAPEIATYVKLRGWEVVEHTEDDGRRVRFKVREPDCGYMLLLKKRA